MRTVGSALAICSKNGVLLDASPAATKLLAVLGVEALTFPFVLPGSIWEAVCSSDEGVATEMQGATDRVRIGCTRYQARDESHLLTFHDPSQLLNESVQRMLTDRRQLMRHVVAGLAHDLRSPLSQIVFRNSVLQDRWEEMSKDELCEHFQAVATSSRKIASVAGAMVDYAKVAPSRHAHADVRDMFERIEAIVRSAHRETKPVFVSSVAEGAESVCSNQIHIELILLELLENALQCAHTPLRFEVTAVREASGDVCIVCTDDGPGMVPALRDCAFEPFVTTKAGGLGLGLTTARSRAQELGGELKISDAQVGTRVELRLPKCRLEEVPWTGRT